MRHGFTDFRKLLKYEAINVARAKWLVLYGLFFAAFTFAVLQFGKDPVKAAASLSSIVLLVIPLISTLYAAVYWYASEPFTSLLLTQPLSRTSVYLARWLATGLALAGTFFFSTLIPLIAQGALDQSTFLLLLLGVLLCVSFVAIGMLVGVLISDRMKGIGVAFMIWMYFALLHDAVVFALVAAFQEYPIEVPAMVLMAINPIDLARVSLLIGLDLAAMMGYTGRILQSALSSSLGLFLTFAALTGWIFFPVWLGLRRFKSKDL